MLRGGDGGNVLTVVPLNHSHVVERAISTCIHDRTREFIYVNRTNHDAQVDCIIIGNLVTVYIGFTCAQMSQENVLSSNHI